MAEKLDEKEVVSFKELLVSQMGSIGCQSHLICVSKATGEILYDAPAGDEG